MNTVRAKGFVFNREGEPIPNSKILIWSFSLDGETTTNDEGFYSITVTTYEDKCTIYAFFDDPETPGYDTMPAVHQTDCLGDVNVYENFTLIPAATVYVVGEIRSIEAMNYNLNVLRLEVMDPNGAVLHVDDFNLVYGSGLGTQSHLLGLEPWAAIVPAGTPFKIKVTSEYQQEKTEYRRGWFGSERTTTMVDSSSEYDMSKEAYFILGVGEVLTLDIRELTLNEDLVKLDELMDKVNSYMMYADHWKFYTLSESYEFQKVNEHKRVGAAYLEAGDYDAAFIELRQAYLKLEGIQYRLISMFRQALSSLNILVYFVSLTSLMLAAMLVDRWVKRTVATCLLFVAMIFFFYAVYPIGKAFHPQVFINKSVTSLTLPLVVEGVLRKIIGRTGWTGGLSRLGAIASVFSLAKRNLRRRRLRLMFIFSTQLVLTMSFVALTSFSTGYGLIYNRVIGKEPGAEGVLIRLPEYEPKDSYQKGWFYPIIPAVTSWVSNVEGVSNIAVKAESTPTLGAYAVLGDWPIHGILGVEPDKEPLMNAIDAAVVEGSPLRENDTCLLDESLLRSDAVELEDIVDIQGVRLRVVGAFDSSISMVKDLDGDPILPKYQISYTPGADMPFIEVVTCEPEKVVITTLSTALRIEGVCQSRVALKLQEGVDAHLLGKSMALTKDYRFWISLGGAVHLAHCGVQVDIKGLPLIVPWTIVVLSIMTTALSSIYERRGEIKILSSVGWTPGHISGVFLAEALIIGFVAGGLGYLLGLGWYPLMARFNLAPIVQQKVSVVWLVAAINISTSSVLVGSILALRGSVVLTPSLRRRWSLSSIPVSDRDAWDMTMPIKIEDRLLESFISYMRKSLRKHGNPDGVVYISGLKETVDDVGGEKAWIYRFSYREGPVTMGGKWASNVLTIGRGEGHGGYSVNLTSKGDRESVHRTVSFIRSILINWATDSGK